jgi:hypothetical protein
MDSAMNRSLWIAASVVLFLAIAGGAMLGYRFYRAYDCGRYAEQGAYPDEAESLTRNDPSCTAVVRSILEARQKRQWSWRQQH